MTENLNTEKLVEDAADLVFPKKLENTETLLISEVNLLLNRGSQKYEEDEITEENQNVKEYYLESLKIKSLLHGIRGMLIQKMLHKFELVSLANLCPETPEEAKGLIPSLEGRFEDEELRS